MTRPESFYEKLAYLFYAIADADGKVKPAELQRLHEEIILIWKSLDNVRDEFNTNLAFEIEAIFEWLEDNKYPCMDAYREFTDYATTHKSLFDADVKDKIMHTCLSIAGAYKQINHSEEHILEKLKTFLKQL
jgi:uncharacterized tellurite resistance protein B-like protein